MKIVKFLHKSGIYNPGDIAAFDDKTAEKIVENKYGEYVNIDLEKKIESNKTKEMRPNRHKKGYVTK